jgi:hypothetical protein
VWRSVWQILSQYFKCLLGNKQAFLSSRSGHTNCDSFMRCEVPDVLKDCSDTVLLGTKFLIF